MVLRTLARINIYVPDRDLRRRVKSAAAQRDLSVSEYCVRAITAQLVRDDARTAAVSGAGTPGTAVARARRFQARTFKGRRLRVSSATLIRQSRAGRSAGA